MKIMAVMSGGLDSGVMAWQLKRSSAANEVIAVSFGYGQRHEAQEMHAAHCLAKAMGIQRFEVDIRVATAEMLERGGSEPLGSFLLSSLTGQAKIPHGHYTEASMASTVVPMRNPMMLTVAASLAIGQGCDAVAIGAHSGDHAIYPDCRPEFIHAFWYMVQMATDGTFGVMAPFLNCTKKDIVAIGHQLGFPFELTWTCYEGRGKPCGKCGSCVERREAFALNGLTDPAEYEEG